MLLETFLLSFFPNLNFQAALEKQGKAHLEEELRAELEEKEHVIVTLNTKVALLKEAAGREVTNGGQKETCSEGSGQLVDLGEEGGQHSLEEGVEEKGQAEKVRRLESLLSKCKENIKANKQKMQALTEVKEQLSMDLEAKESELVEERERGVRVASELTELRGREAGEELQMAEVKLAMHKEMLDKDEEIGSLRSNFVSATGEKEGLQQQVKAASHPDVHPDSGG